MLIDRVICGELAKGGVELRRLRFDRLSLDPEKDVVAGLLTRVIPQSEVPVTWLAVAAARP